jgi:hypothetical protein
MKTREKEVWIAKIRAQRTYRARLGCLKGANSMSTYHKVDIKRPSLTAQGK